MQSLRRFWRDREVVKRERQIRDFLFQLSGPDKLKRHEAAFELSAIGDPRAVAPLLVAHERETDSFFRLMLAARLAEFHRPEALLYFFEDVKRVDEQGSYDWDDAPGLISALAGLGDVAFPALINALTDNNQAVQWIAIETLGEMKDPRAIPHLRALLSDSSAGKFAAEAIATIEARQG